MLVSKCYSMNYLRKKKKVIFVLIMCLGMYNNKIIIDVIYAYAYSVYTANMESEHVFLSVIYVGHKHNS